MTPVPITEDKADYEVILKEVELLRMALTPYADTKQMQGMLRFLDLVETYVKTSERERAPFLALGKPTPRQPWPTGGVLNQPTLRPNPFTNQIGPRTGTRLDPHGNVVEKVEDLWCEQAVPYSDIMKFTSQELAERVERTMAAKFAEHLVKEHLIDVTEAPRDALVNSDISLLRGHLRVLKPKP